MDESSLSSVRRPSLGGKSLGESSSGNLASVRCPPPGGKSPGESYSDKGDGGETSHPLGKTEEAEDEVDGLHSAINKVGMSPAQMHCKDTGLFIAMP